LYEIYNKRMDEQITEHLSIECAAAGEVVVKIYHGPVVTRMMDNHCEVILCLARYYYNGRTLHLGRHLQFLSP
jgi:hypothetical protein